MQTTAYSPQRHPFREHPLLRLVFPFMAGILAGEYGYSCLQHRAGWLWLLAVVIGGIGYVVQIFRPALFRHSRLSQLFVAFCALLAGAALYVPVGDGVRQKWPAAPQSYRVLVTDTPRETAKTFQVTAHIAGGPFSSRKVRLALMKDTARYSCRSGGGCAAADVPIRVGDALLVHARMEPPRAAGNPGEFDYASWLRWQGIGGVGFCPLNYWRKSEVLSSSWPVVVYLRHWRECLTDHYAHYFSGRDLGVLAAMTLGDKKWLDADTRGVYSRSGVSHILALSGLHLAILFSFWNVLVMPLARRRRFLSVILTLSGLGALWSFVCLAGCPLSLVRAAVMFSVMQLATLWRGDYFSLNTLALAALLILSTSPAALFDIGFQLSFLSVAGILIVMPRLRWPLVLRPDAECVSNIVSSRCLRALFLTGRFCRQRRALVRGMISFCVVSLTAQLITMPLVAYYFHIVAPYGLLGNFVAVPLAYPLLALSALFLLLPVLQPLLAPLLAGLLTMLHAALDAVGTLPGAGLYFAPPLVAVVLCYVACFLLVTAINLRRALWLYAASAAFALTFLACLWDNGAGRRRFVVYNLRGATVLGFQTGAQQARLWSPDTLRVARSLAYLRHNPAADGRLASAPWLVASRPLAGLYAADGLFALPGLRVAVLHAPLGPAVPRCQLAVDYLVIVRGYRQPLADALRRYRPRILVLDASLSDFHRERLLHEACRIGVAVHDVCQAGALVVDL